MISIVVPVYNAENYIEETVRSVVAQTYKDWELLLVDDVSKDQSVQVIEKLIREYPACKIRLIRQEKNAGAAAARNRGIDEAKGQYIAFLDADDIWYPDKLTNQMQFMEKHDAGLVFSAYEFGDENAKPTGKMVRVPKTLTYRKALSRTVIFTSTVLIDTGKTGKPYMPQVGSEDTATWWAILKNGITAYGLNQPLAIYRRPAHSLSSNKKVAIKRIWNLYRNVEHLGVLQSLWLLLFWAYRATIRRVIDDAVRAHFEAFKRFTVLQLSLIGLVFHTLVYTAYWFQRLYPELMQTRYNITGIRLGEGIRLYFRGHLLILFLYFIFLIFLSSTSGGMKTGFLKPGTVFSSEVTALTITNIVTYFQLSLMRNWLLNIVPFLELFAIQIGIAAIWAFLSDYIYRTVFPPRETLIVDLGTDRQSLEITKRRFNTRDDRFRIMKTMQNASMDEMKAEALRWYGCVVIVGEDSEKRRELLEYCYGHFIRIYLMPDIDDLLIQGSEQMSLFDTPVLEMKEYTIRWETRAVKRVCDFILVAIFLILSSPIQIARLLSGEKIKKELCKGKDEKIFTKYGSGLLNVLGGSMALVGPEPVEVEEAVRREAIDSRYLYRYRIKPGIKGYAQMYCDENSDIEDHFKMDLYYIQHYSFLNDFKLLIQRRKRKEG